MKYSRRSDGAAWAALGVLAVWLLMFGSFWLAVGWVILHFLFKFW